MISADQISETFAAATREFRDGAEYRSLVSGGASDASVREFLRNVFRTHYLSAHIVALCFAALPASAAA